MAKEILTTLKFKEIEEPKIGEHFYITPKMNWVTGTDKDGKEFEIKTSAGFGGTEIYFNYLGKSYKADITDLFIQLIKI